MDDFIKVDNIEFKYIGTNLEEEFLYTEIIIDGKVYRFNEYYWEDDIPLWAVLYEMVKSDEKYTLVTERDGMHYDEYRIRKANNDLVQLLLNFDCPKIKVRCEFKKEKLLDMLRTLLLSAAADKKYMRPVFDVEYYDIVNNEEDKRTYQEYLAMLNEQILPISVFKEVEKYNMARNKNVYSRFMNRQKTIDRI